jgi:homoserine dehydrogenase
LYTADEKDVLMTKIQEVPIIFLGVGNIGGMLLRQILDRGDAVTHRTGLRLVPVALADVSGVLIDADGLPEETLQAALKATADGGLLESLPGLRPLDEVDKALRPGTIIADLTASSKTEPTLRAALDGGCSVVLANKIPLAGEWSKAQSLLEHPNLRYECTVGAGLPVIDTLHYLLDTGDRVTMLEGCLSGTLGFLCAQLERGTSYSQAIEQARTLGYTEPDPRDDLSGKDVARKALILARTASWPLEEADLTVEALYSGWLADLSAEEFMENTHTLDDEYAARVEKAQNEGKVLRYVAQVSAKGGTVGLVAVDRDSPLGSLRGPANYIALYTERYNEVPLVISGPGAGKEVTAAGAMGDIIELARKMKSAQGRRL